MNIQFNHKRNSYNIWFSSETGEMIAYSSSIEPRGGTTVALEVIEPWFFDSLAVSDFFEKKVGNARCSKDDNYCKKIGRELATQRMKTVRFVVQSIVGNDKEKIVVLIDANNNLYTLKKVNGHRVHFVGYNE